MVAVGMAERRKSSGSKSPRTKSSGSSRSKSSGSQAPRASRKKSDSSQSRPDRPGGGPAPSAGDIDKLEKFEASEEAKAHEPSTVEAMGRDKRREVGGPS